MDRSRDLIYFQINKHNIYVQIFLLESLIWIEGIENFEKKKSFIVTIKCDQRFLSLISFLMFLLIQDESLSLQVIFHFLTMFLIVLLNKDTFSLTPLFKKCLFSGNSLTAFLIISMFSF